MQRHYWVTKILILYMENNNMFLISIFNSVKDKTPKNNNSDYLIELINNPKVCNVKEANILFAPAKFNGTRSIKNVLEVYALVLDYDSKGSTNINFNEEIKALETLGLTFWAYTTHSHTEEKNCFRVILPLKEPIPNVEYTKLWNWAYKITQEKIDKACKDISRISYLPCHKENTPYKTHIFEGKLLDWKNLPSIEQKADKEEKPFNNGNQTKSSVNHTKTYNKPNSEKNGNNHNKTYIKDNDPIWKYCLTLPESISGSHGHNDLSRCAYVLVQGFGLSEIEAYPYFERWNREKAKPPENNDQLKHKLSDALNASLNGHKRGWLNLELNSQRQTKQTKVKEHKLDDLDFAKEFTDTYPQFKYDSINNYWREWVNTHWKEFYNVLDIKKAIVEIVKDLSPNTYVSAKKVDSIYKLAQIEARQIFKQDNNLINFQNGTLHLKDDKFYEHSKNDLLCNYLPYSYNPSGATPYKIANFLQETFTDKETMRAFIAHAGLALMKDTSLHRALVIIGATRSGKTTAIALLNLIAGLSIEDAFSFASVSLFDRGPEGKRARAIWNNKPIVCVDELPVEAFRSEETLKCMVAHSGIEMRDLFKSEQVNNRWLPKLAFTTNDKPTIKDFSGAIAQRLLILEAPNKKTDGKQNRKLLDEFLPELGLFAYHCLEFAKQALASGDYPTSAKMTKDLEEISLLSNPIKHFLKDYCIENKDSWLSIDNIYKEYKRFIEKEGYSKAETKPWFSRKLSDMGHKLEKRLDIRGVLGLELNVKALKNLESNID